MARTSPESRMLKTTVEVMTALGGIDGVSGLTGSRYKATENWGRAKTFPARYFLVMTRALRRKRLSAPPELWGMVTPDDRQQSQSETASTQKRRAA